MRSEQADSEEKYVCRKCITDCGLQVVVDKYAENRKCSEVRPSCAARFVRSWACKVIVASVCSWDQAARDIAANWKLSTGLLAGDAKQAAGTFGTRVDVWLSGSIQLNDLKVPRNVSVTSGGEIESFVKKHREEGGK